MPIAHVKDLFANPLSRFGFPKVNPLTPPALSIVNVDQPLIDAYIAPSTFATYVDSDMTNVELFNAEAETDADEDVGEPPCSPFSFFGEDEGESIGNTAEFFEKYSVVSTADLLEQSVEEIINDEANRYPYSIPELENEKSFKNSGTWFIGNGDGGVTQVHGELFNNLSWLFPASELHPSAYPVALPAKTDLRDGSSSLADTISWVSAPSNYVHFLPIELAYTVHNHLVPDLRTGFSTNNECEEWLRDAEMRPCFAADMVYDGSECYQSTEELEPEYQKEEESEAFVLEAPDTFVLEEPVRLEVCGGRRQTLKASFIICGRIFTLGLLKLYSLRWDESLSKIFLNPDWNIKEVEQVLEQARRCRTIVSILEPFLVHGLAPPEEVFELLETSVGCPLSPMDLEENEFEI